ncbi:hypothetical protein [Pseudolysinimonas kribbensis]|uniref:hypothetical protein n=1 Tax=Pseudolysinimonas kribbensis TaxID=433641 RepID=UPI0024E0B8E8|nr:hypothetical protein [Pseudolysinimonas kribbensis]
MMPFAGGAGPSLFEPAYAAESAAIAPVAASDPAAAAPVTDAADAASAVTVQTASVLASARSIPDTEHLAQKPVPKPVVITPQAAASRDGARRCAAPRARRPVSRARAAAAGAAARPGGPTRSDRG